MVLVRDVCWSLRTHGRAISEANELAITLSSTEGLVPLVRELKCITPIFPFFSANHDDMVDIDPYRRIRRHIREDEAERVVKQYFDWHLAQYQNDFLLQRNDLWPDKHEVII